MKIPVVWLKDFVDLDASIEPQRLADDLTSIGIACDGIEGTGDDAVLDLDVTTNRVDAMNVYGVAREVAAFYGKPLKPIPADVTEDSARAAADALNVEIAAPELCPRFAARVFDVRVGPSPEWMKRRLELAGQRSISNLVDLTNYVMLETGQPSHAFDLARVPGATLRARMATNGETVKTLDGIDRVLASSMGVVAGEGAALAIAGVMGGASSEISDDTKTVALEAAYWNALLVRRASKALGMHTEASHRFERGADPLAPPVGLDRLAHLLVREGMGTVRAGLIDVVARPFERTVIRVSLDRAADVIGELTSGERIKAQRVLKILGALGFETTVGESLSLVVRPPSWRGDVQREIDVIEEIARFTGLQNVARTRPPSRGAASLTPRQKTERAVRQTLAGRGFRECVQLAFAAAARVPEVPGRWLRSAVANPLSSDQDALRTSLVMPGLIEATSRNQRHDARDLALFELGRVFLRDPDGQDPSPAEAPRLGAILAGSAPRDWSARPRPVDFFDLKAIVQELLDRFGPAGGVRFERDGVPPFFHPGRSVSIVDAGTGESIGCFGELHPDTIAAFELKDRPLAAEVSLAALDASDHGRYAPFSRYPGVARDLSFHAPEALEAARVLDLARTAAGPSARRVALIDRFEGKANPKGTVSLAITIEFQRDDRTLESAEVDSALDAVRRALAAAGCSMRAA